MNMPRLPEPEYMDLPDEAAAYARADFRDVNAAFVERLLQLVPTHEEKSVVDLGTGPADIPLRLLTERPAWSVMGIDGSPAMLAIAHLAAFHVPVGSRLTLIRGDACRSPVSSQTFDIVVSNSILHHVSDPMLLWQEIRRLGKPGATVFLRDLRRPDNIETAQALVEQYAGGESPLLREEFYRSLLAAYTPAEVTDQLSRAGLQQLQVAVSSDRHLDVVGQLV